MKRVVVIGAGAHGREVAEILRYQTQTAEESEVFGFIDDNPDLAGQLLGGLPVLGDWSWFERVDRVEIAVICGVGTPQVCWRLVQWAKTRGLTFVSAISSLAYVSPHAHIGQGVIIYPHVAVNTGACLGDHCTLNAGTTVSHDTRVGPYTNVNPGVHLAGDVTIGEGCYIGMGANVIQGVSIGHRTVVGAGAVVIRDLPPNVTAVGVPARVIKEREEGWYER